MSEKRIIGLIWVFSVVLKGVSEGGCLRFEEKAREGGLEGCGGRHRRI